jgi:NADPH:quinone reductase-like Zn-dependent oxidoreductase
MAQIPSTMKAWLFSGTTGGIEKNLQIQHDIPLPTTASTLKQDQVLIKTEAAALNPADYKLPETPWLRMLAMKLPCSPGLDFSGRIAALGPSSGKVNGDLKEGQLVVGCFAFPAQYGALSEYLVCTRSEIAPAPQGMPAEDAACLGVAGLTAYQSIKPYVKEDDNVFINGGSGGVGLFGIQIAKILGCKVTITCSSANADLCKNMGADRVIDYRTSDVVEELKKSDSKYDLVVDNVDTWDIYWKMGSFTNPGAPFIWVSTSPDVASIIEVFRRFLTPSLLGGPGRKLVMLMKETKADQLAEISQWVTEGKVKLVKDSTFAYKDAPRAFERLKTGRARGKVVINSE